MIPPSGPTPEELKARSTPHDEDDVVCFRYISPPYYEHLKRNKLKKWDEQAKENRAKALKKQEEAVKNLPDHNRKAVGSPTFSEFVKLKEDIDPTKPRVDPKTFDWKAKSDLKKSKPAKTKVRS